MVVDPIIIQKLNVAALARSARSLGHRVATDARVVRSIASRQAAVGYHVGQAGHIGAAFRLRQPAYRVGIVGGYAAGGAVRSLAPRVAAARSRGAAIGASIRTGYNSSRALRGTVARDVSARRLPLAYALQAIRAERRGIRPGGPSRRGYWALAHALDRAPIATSIGANAGSVANRVERGVRAGRVWVHNARVSGGGFWRRLTGA